ncbi:tripartite tricarboxylate transporter substrate binding protein [soil metagenome]
MKTSESNNTGRAASGLTIGARLLISIALVVLAAVPPVVMAQQDYPNKPIRLVDPYAPGGSTGAVTQALAQKFKDFTGQAMVVDHRPGAGSNIGSDIVAKAPADGYTVLLGTSSLSINPTLYKSMTFDPAKDLAPIALLIRAPNVLAVKSSLPITSVKELIAYAKANPGKLSYGSSGNGATNHLAMEQFKQATGTDMVHIPFKGGGEAMQALVGGQTDLMFNPASTLAPQEKSGRIRMLAVASAARVNGLDLPTVAEAGVPGFEGTVWFGLFAPAGTPPAIIAKLNTETNRALADPGVRSLLEKAGMQILGGTPEELRTVMAADYTRWAKVVRGANLQVD